MQVDISFDFAKVYNIDKADVVSGQKFTLSTDFDNGKWFSDQDQVLSLKVSGRDAEATANEVGTSTILIMDSSFTIQKQLVIKVVEQILPMAQSLNPEAETPIQK
jgi:hypothetical protein